MTTSATTRRCRAARVALALLVALTLGAGFAPADTADARASSSGSPVSLGAGRRAVEYGIRTDRGLAARDRSLLMAWLNGAPLPDPRLVAWVDAATMGHPVEGAGPMARGAPPPCR